MNGDFSHLRGWTPVAFDTETATLEWADLRPGRFDRPFFRHSIEAWRGGDSPESRYSDLAALFALDREPSLDPKVIIAQASRCGSTLLARLTTAFEGTIAIGEPVVLTEVLSFAQDLAGHPRPHEVLRACARALGRIRFGTERNYVLKLNGLSVRFLPLFRQAFPRAKIVWLQRRPIEIVESSMRVRDKRLGPQAITEQAFHETLRKLAIVFLAAKCFVEGEMRVLDYRDLPQAVEKVVAPLLGVAPTARELARLEDLCRFDSHTGEPFVRGGPIALPRWVEEAVERSLDPIYLELDRRRHAAGAGA